MPQIEPHLNDVGEPISPPAPRTALFWDGTHWHVPRVDDHGRVQVRGEDQLFSIKGVLAEERTAVISAAGGFIDSDPCDAGQYWVVTTVYAYDATSPCTNIFFQNRHDAVPYGLHSRVFAFPAAMPETWSGLTVLDPSDTIRAYFAGALAGDTCHIAITGYRVTLEV